MGQIASSKVPIQAVLLVGGFGASNYLKERLRNSIDNSVKVMQPTNAWLAVVHGAVMKGLALCAPESMATVRVANRKARKHYGFIWGVEYDDSMHGYLYNKRYWHTFSGSYNVEVMNWFIRKGDAVSENEPFAIPFYIYRRVSHGPLWTTEIVLYTDGSIREAPLEKDHRVTELCMLKADLSHIPESQLRRETGKDGKVSFRDPISYLLFSSLYYSYPVQPNR